MTCSCCETGRCCNGSTCNELTQSECEYKSRQFLIGGDCVQHTCTSSAPYNSPCQIVDGCACAASGKVFRPEYTTCDCAILTAAGVPYGGCQAYYCNACVNGNCQLTCPSPRQCCAGVCCPESQSCNQNSGNCVNKCSTGTTYCNTTASGGAYAYACCESGTKCCGSSGCLGYTSTTGSGSLSSDKSPGSSPFGWFDTGITLGSGDSVSITVSGTVPEGSGTATPDGKASDCSNSNRFDTRFCYMAILGMVGTTGTPFLVGTSYSGSPGAGTLYLRVNRLNFINGESQGGFFSISWTRKADPCPGYTPAAVGEPIVYSAGEEFAGPGTQLKVLLGLAGIVSSPTCSCNAHAAQMDAWQELGCLARLPTILGWLKEESHKRGLWFFGPAGLALVLAAISLSALKRPFRGNSR